MPAEHALVAHRPRVARAWYSRGVLTRVGAVLHAHPRLSRWVLSGPIVFVATVFVMMGMAFWWPVGAARVDHIALPVLLFPLIWAGLFFYALIDDDLLRAGSVLIGLIVVHLGLFTLNMG
ncbi:MAG: hypothetical protein AAF496_07755 [Pseudomonadota bacterium]